MENIARKNEYKDWANVPYIELVEYLELRHRIIMNEKIPRLAKLLEKMLSEYKGEFRKILESLREIFNAVISEKEIHIKREEEMLFSYIKKLINFQAAGGDKPEILINGIQNPISLIKNDHIKVEHALLETMNKIATVFQSIDSFSDTFKLFYNDLKDLETEFMDHMRLETDILFPKAIELELNVKHGNK